jgi:hypothetical protein
MLITPDLLFQMRSSISHSNLLFGIRDSQTEVDHESATVLSASKSVFFLGEFDEDARNPGDLSRRSLPDGRT